MISYLHDLLHPGTCAGGFYHPVDPTEMLLLNPAKLSTLDVIDVCKTNTG